MPQPATVIIAAGIAAALHVGKLPPALTALQQALGLTLVEAGFLLSLVQLAGMGAGVVLGLAADAFGGRRSVVAGLLTLAAASAAGAGARDAAALMALRAVEGLGFLLVVLPAPGLVRRLVPAQRLAAMLGVWGTYMPLATALALLVGPLAVDVLGWQGWWLALAAVAAGAAMVVVLRVPADERGASRTAFGGWGSRLLRTLRSPGPWLVAVSFAVYSSQWLAVVGFLPTIYQQAGVGGAAVGALTALAAAVNIVGNVGGGRLLQRGIAAPRLLTAGFAVMGLTGVIAFAGIPGFETPPALRYVAVLVFSGAGGMIPATLFALAVRLAPGDDTVATTIGWVQQWSSFGQFAGPPVVAWVAARAGGWQWTWLVTGACALAGLALSRAIAARLPR